MVGPRLGRGRWSCGVGRLAGCRWVVRGGLTDRAVGASGGGCWWDGGGSWLPGRAGWGRVPEG